MREVDFLDKENGTRNGLLGPQMSDSDHNIMRELQHEPCEWHCDDCGCCDDGEPANYLPGDDEPYCDDCADHYYKQLREREQS